MAEFKRLWIAIECGNASGVEDNLNDFRYNIIHWQVYHDDERRRNVLVIECTDELKIGYEEAVDDSATS